MSKLHKFNIPGQIHFITTNTNLCAPIFLANDPCRILLQNVDFYRRKHNFKLIGYVIMPDHFHALIYPMDDVPIQRILQDIKRYSAKQILERLDNESITWESLRGIVIPLENLKLANSTSAIRCLKYLHVPTKKDFLVAKSRTSGQEHQIWQKSFYDFNIFTEKMLKQKLNYIHRNPLMWKLVHDPVEYPYSSYQNYSGAEALIDIDWL